MPDDPRNTSGQPAAPPSPLVVVEREALEAALRFRAATDAAADHARSEIWQALAAPPSHLPIPMEQVEAIATWRRGGGYIRSDGMIGEERAANALTALASAWQATQEPPPPAEEPDEIDRLADLVAERLARRERAS